MVQCDAEQHLHYYTVVQDFAAWLSYVTRFLSYFHFELHLAANDGVMVSSKVKGERWLETCEWDHNHQLHFARRHLIFWASIYRTLVVTANQCVYYVYGQS